MPKMKQAVKDSVFTRLFREPEYALQLYRVLHPEDTEATEEDLELVTLENILTTGQYNDLGLRIRDKLILLMEAQSTFSPNISLRLLMYLAESYKEYVEERKLDIYSNKAVRLPRPELYVVYTGDREDVPETLRLSDLYEGAGGAEIQVKVLRGGDSRDILDQYVRFCKIADASRERYGRTMRAVEALLKQCIEEDILAPFLASRQKEVEDIMVTLFDQEKVWEIHEYNVVKEAQARGIAQGMEQGIAQGMEQGMEQGIAQGIKATALRMLAAGKYALEEIAAISGLSVEDVELLRASQDG